LVARGLNRFQADSTSLLDGHWLPLAAIQRDELIRKRHIADIQPGPIWDRPNPPPEYPDFRLNGEQVHAIVVDGARVQIIRLFPLSVSAEELFVELGGVLDPKPAPAPPPPPPPAPLLAPAASEPRPHPTPTAKKPVSQGVKRAKRPVKRGLKKPATPPLPLHVALALLRQTAGPFKNGWAANWRAHRVIFKRFGTRAPTVWRELRRQHKVVLTGYFDGRNELVMIRGN
jgi:hypothetical protein